MYIELSVIYTFRRRHNIKLKILFNIITLISMACSNSKGSACWGQGREPGTVAHKFNPGIWNVEHRAGSL